MNPHKSEGSFSKQTKLSLKQKILNYLFKLADDNNILLRRHKYLLNNNHLIWI